MIKTFIIYTILDYCIESFSKTIATNFSPVGEMHFDIGEFFARIEYEIIDGDMLYTGYFYNVIIRTNNGATIGFDFETAYHHVEHMDDMEMSAPDIKIVNEQGYVLCDNENYCAHIEVLTSGKYVLDIIHISHVEEFVD